MYIVHIKRNSDNKIKKRTYKDECLEFMWSEGGYSCDCNRGVFFGDYTLNDEDICGNGKYSVNIFDENNNKLYKEY